MNGAERSNDRLIKQAIESAKCRIYKLNFDLDGKLSAHHQKKAENQKELMEITVEALEKQIPKKPNMEREDMEGNIIERCPRCFSMNIDVYCSRCGQLIDWGD